MPFTPLSLLLFLFLLVFLLALVQVGAISLAFEKLGLSPGSGFTLLFGSLLGSAFNIPLFRIPAEPPPDGVPTPPLPGMLRPRWREFRGHTVIALNVGGGLIPVLFSLYLFTVHPLPPVTVLAGIALVAAVSYQLSRPIAGLGIGMPILVAPITAALVALLLAPRDSAPLAYVCGTLGVLIGADLLHLKDIRRMGTPLASIGGAGTFDGIFLTGILAVLLA